MTGFEDSPWAAVVRKKLEDFESILGAEAVTGGGIGSQRLDGLLKGW